MLLGAALASCNRSEQIRGTESDADGARPITSTSRASQSMVVEYTPAAGQFIGDAKSGGFTGNETTAQSAVEYAQSRLAEQLFVSLGGFGGYLVVMFDHSILSDDGYNIAIAGNALQTSNEPGVVWVMQDTNSNGKADDEWYELAGSDSGADYARFETLKNYSVTYARPSADGQAVTWRDSEGASGQIDYLIAYHDQPSYYPTWIPTETYTLTGTCLKAKNYDRSNGAGTDWINPPYDWGYVDNQGSDYLTMKIDGTNQKINRFRISDAVKADGTAAELKYVDFVKIQTAVNTKSGWLGESSTEVCGVYDYNMIKL